MRVTVIGCSGSFPGPDSPASCYLVQAAGFSLLLDLGNGALGSLQRIHTSMFDIDAVLLSHLHADHCLDMCGYWVARTYCPGGPAPKLDVHGPADTAEHLRRAYDLEPPGMGETFNFHTLVEGISKIGPFTVTSARMNHPVEAWGFRIEYGGQVLAYSGDTGESSALIEIARGADLFLCEASFLDLPNLPTEMHLTGREAGEHAAKAGAERLVLTHLIPWNDPARTLAEAKGSGFRGTIDVAHTGQVFEL